MALMACVKRRAVASKRDPNSGMTMREHWRASKHNPDAQRMLRFPRYPVALEYLDEWHQELSAGRQEGHHAVAPLTWRDIESWVNRTKRDVEPHEANALLAIDSVYRSVFLPESTETPKSEPSSVLMPAWPSREEE